MRYGSGMRRRSGSLTRVLLDRHQDKELLRLSSEPERPAVAKERAQCRSRNGDAQHQHDRESLMLGEEIERGGSDQNAEYSGDDHRGKDGTICLGVEEIGLLADYFGIVFSRHVLLQ